MSTITIPIALLRESLEISQESGALCEKVAAERATLAAKAPLVADMLVEGGVIDPYDRKETVAMLMDPLLALDIVGRMAKRANASPRSLGQGAANPHGSTKQSATDTVPTRESDRGFLEMLGVS